MIRMMIFAGCDFIQRGFRCHDVTFSLFNSRSLKQPHSLHKKYPLIAGIHIHTHAVVFLALLKAPQRRESKQSVSVVSNFVPPRKRNPHKKGVFRVFKKKARSKKGQKFSLETTEREREREEHTR